MIDPAFVQRMARYNRWQNENLYGAAERLPRAELERERGAFFGSIHKTLSHLLWADHAWLSRFRGTAAPQGGISESVSLHPDWEALRRERAAFDVTIIDWADRINSTALAGDLTWFSAATQRQMTGPKWALVTHMFNHQTHHRGQVHCMLTQAGGVPHDTDLMLLPE